MPSYKISFDNSYGRLPGQFYTKLAPTPVAAPRLIELNRGLCARLNLDAEWLSSSDGIAVLAGNRIVDGSEPLAAAYAGHQFGQFVPQLGDGRAILLGEIIDADGQRFDLQLKGSGPTPYSRRGDGRAALGPVLREYVVSEAMAALGIPTTRALAAVLTGEEVWRDTVLPGAVLTRVAASHVRVGTFQYFAARGDNDSVRTLADYVIARHYPDAPAQENAYRALLDAVVMKQANLVAQWMAVGFIHGVMNTDNTSVAGETIDYGPCAFMDAYHPATVLSSIDRMGRYAYGNQATIAQWNLMRFAECLLPLLAADETAAVEVARASLGAFAGHFNKAYVDAFAGKLGFSKATDCDLALIQDLLRIMAESAADFTLTFRLLCGAAGGAAEELRGVFLDGAAFDAWFGRWQHRLGEEGADRSSLIERMRQRNPAYIPRNHRVEEAIGAAQTDGDFRPFETLLAVLAHPYDDQPRYADFMTPPRADQVVRQTFCGT